MNDNNISRVPWLQRHLPKALASLVNAFVQGNSVFDQLWNNRPVFPPHGHPYLLGPCHVCQKTGWLVQVNASCTVMEDNFPADYHVFRTTACLACWEEIAETTYGSGLEITHL